MRRPRARRAGGWRGALTGKLTGYMEENAFLELQKRVPLPDTEDLLAAYDKAQRSYASYGVATVQEG